MSQLNSRVLLLNKLWIPIRIITVRRCIKLACAGKLGMVNTDDYSVVRWSKWSAMEIKDNELYIQSSHSKIKVPEAAVLFYCDKVYVKGGRLTKNNIYVRDEYVCQYTGKKLTKEEADIDHIIPRSKGGGNSWDNLVVCSKIVNRNKGNLTPEEAGLSLIKKPKKPIANRLRVSIPPSYDAPLSWKKLIGTRGGIYAPE